MADALVSGASDRKVVEVQLLSAAPLGSSPSTARSLARWARALIVCGSALLFIFSTFVGVLTLTDQGIVFGGLRPCDALGVSHLHYAAGTVSVLHGHVTWSPVSAGVAAASFPSAVAAEQTVGANSGYLFDLNPGRYVLRGRYTGGSDAAPWVDVTVKAGSIQYVDVPDLCI